MRERKRCDSIDPTRGHTGLKAALGLGFSLPEVAANRIAVGAWTSGVGVRAYAERRNGSLNSRRGRLTIHKAA